jgi:adenylate kinase family enzyme
MLNIMIVIKMETRLIVLVGRCGVGKSTLAKSLDSIYKLQFPIYEVGTYVYRAFNENSSLYNDSLDCAIKTTRKEGSNFFIEQLCQDIQNDNPKGAIIVGIRSQSEVDYLKSISDRLLFIGLTAKESVIQQRFFEREMKRKEIDFVLNDYRIRSSLETMWGIDNVLHNCDHLLHTDGLSLKEIGEKTMIYL